MLLPFPWAFAHLVPLKCQVPRPTSPISPLSTPPNTQTFLLLKAVTPVNHLRHGGGVADIPGLYALGLPVLRRRKSTFICGIEDDAREVIDHLTRYLAARR